MLEKDTIIAAIELKNKDEKMKELEIKNENLEEDKKGKKTKMSEMYIEKMKCSRNEKNLSIALIFS